MSVIYHLKDIATLDNKKIFFDTNILIYLFYASDSKLQEECASLYNELLKSKALCYTSFLNISEFYSRCMKIEFEKAKELDEQLKYKNFRNSEEGSEIEKDITNIVKLLLAKFSLVMVDFDKNFVAKILDNETIDLCDKALVEICKQENMILFTNDKDFKNKDLNILALKNF
ncbi:PIN domain-containing protein [Campylobacter lari]|uniref:type II toxin-antitoxin system VapC family toxin n=1 Tax=unclassified Campylobacter TaxID=2593542 RepID=UPI00140658AC|nr:MULTISPECIES: PIN domain-containing protein [unclassified Campylobacter]EAI7262556.1 PIN domain-containing protein [Campylobacter lari]EAK0436249.1 PIN domain-containing protein [Campylobacter lari]EGK8076056.1 PIN domain-containing protein [Campylobacter lari]EGO0809307.1 PIN domain-containing protein [Campylobacter lari]MCV3397097.1 PIN domain-containing protein [Campylobacter sp. RKI_CA19_01116]